LARARPRSSFSADAVPTVSGEESPTVAPLAKRKGAAAYARNVGGGTELRPSSKIEASDHQGGVNVFSDFEARVKTNELAIFLHFKCPPG
jgi:hypothetical protein